MALYKYVYFAAGGGWVATLTKRRLERSKHTFFTPHYMGENSIPPGRTYNYGIYYITGPNM